MHVLIVKTSSLGDVIHTLPALTDAGNALGDITFDWVVEESFAAIPSWHPLVKKVIPVAWRRWRKNLLSKKNWQEYKVFYKDLTALRYDAIIDAQGLVKSALIARQAKGTKRFGFNAKSAREALAAFFYQTSFHVKKKQHAIQRVRQLFAQTLQYTINDDTPYYGIPRQHFVKNPNDKKYLVFLHGTTWTTKHWPEVHWVNLAKLANQQGYHIKLLWGSQEEYARAERIARASSYAEVMPRLDLMSIADVLAGATGVIGVDTGLGHLAAALDVPGVSLYGPTNAKLTGALGASQIHLSSAFACAPCLSRECQLKGREKAKLLPPCFEDLTPQQVWQALEKLIA